VSVQENFAATRAPRPDHLGRFKFLSVGQTHVGHVREMNEDALLNRPDIGLWAIADGMGGHVSGDIASAAVVKALNEVSTFSSAYAFRDAATRAVLSVNESLMAQGGPAKSGSTIVALLAHDGHYACMWAGDSRAYLYRRGALRALTRDHSVVQDLVDAGLLAPDQAGRHPQANLITRAVGASNALDLDYVFGALNAGDRFLLCSDGLSSFVSDREIALALRRTPLETASQTLVDLALARGGRDNITVVLVSAERR
jgi:serine/threonine protein phosphatase PrpC